MHAVVLGDFNVLIDLAKKRAELMDTAAQQHQPSTLLAISGISQEQLLQNCSIFRCIRQYKIHEIIGW